MKSKKKKTPADYPVLRFTTTTEVYEELMNRIENLVEFHNENLKDGEYRFRNNDIAIEALRKGLAQIEKNAKK